MEAARAEAAVASRSLVAFDSELLYVGPSSGAVADWESFGLPEDSEVAVPGYLPVADEFV